MSLGVGGATPFSQPHANYPTALNHCFRDGSSYNSAALEKRKCGYCGVWGPVGGSCSLCGEHIAGPKAAAPRSRTPTQSSSGGPLAPKSVNAMPPPFAKSDVAVGGNTGGAGRSTTPRHYTFESWVERQNALERHAPDSTEIRSAPRVPTTARPVPRLDAPMLRPPNGAEVVAAPPRSRSPWYARVSQQSAMPLSAAQQRQLAHSRSSSVRSASGRAAVASRGVSPARHHRDEATGLAAGPAFESYQQVAAAAATTASGWQYRSGSPAGPAQYGGYMAYPYLPPAADRSTGLNYHTSHNAAGSRSTSAQSQTFFDQQRRSVSSGADVTMVPTAARSGSSQSFVSAADRSRSGATAASGRAPPRVQCSCCGYHTSKGFNCPVCLTAC